MTDTATLETMTVADLARRWGQSTSTIRRKLDRRLLPSIVLPGSNRQLVPLDAVRAAEKPQTGKPNPEKLTIL